MAARCKVRSNIDSGKGAAARSNFAVQNPVACHAATHSFDLDVILTVKGDQLAKASAIWFARTPESHSSFWTTLIFSNHVYSCADPPTP